MNKRTELKLRAAAPRDVPDILALIKALAEFERLTSMLEVTPERLHEHLFGARPVAEVVIAEQDGLAVGFALFFTNFSTFLGRPGLYLEDLFVRPEYRAGGVGAALLRHLAALAVERECGRFEWSVLDWNRDAIGFYERMGAQVLPDWRICRLTGAALRSLAGAP